MMAYWVISSYKETDKIGGMAPLLLWDIGIWDMPLKNTWQNLTHFKI